MSAAGASGCLNNGDSWGGGGPAGGWGEQTHQSLRLSRPPQPPKAELEDEFSCDVCVFTWRDPIGAAAIFHQLLCLSAPLIISLNHWGDILWINKNDHGQSGGTRGRNACSRILMSTVGNFNLFSAFFFFIFPSPFHTPLPEIVLLAHPLSFKPHHSPSRSVSLSRKLAVFPQPVVWPTTAPSWAARVPRAPALRPNWADELPICHA